MVIKHIVISGGSHKYMISYGILKRLHEKKFWDYSNIETIWATSSGTIVSLFICLQYDWKTLDDFIIKRPWYELFKLKPGQLLDFNTNKGIYTIEILREIVKPLLLGKGLLENITLKEFYDFCKKDIHFFTIEVNSFKIVDLSHKTHPNLPLIDAIYMSACIPGLCKPICNDGNCYLDGGLMLNFPLIPCLNSTKCNENEILGILYDSVYSCDNIDDNSSLLTFIHTIITNVIQHCNEYQKINFSKYTNVIICKTKNCEYNRIKILLENSEEREKIINYGCEQADEHFVNK